MAHAGPIPRTMEDWMRRQEKRTGAQERRPAARSAAQILGPGFGPKAIEVVDWNAEETAFNGTFFSVPNAINSPDENQYWMGQVFATPDGYGYMEVVNYRNPDRVPPTRFIRLFETALGSTRDFSNWMAS